ncbi:uncharacterized protein [Centruroides vittatus]|uniref:uncharacterized protein n=1 Tax=Centruroides vittatus TaxID=120091 RepID=UPI003510B403
MAKAEVSSEEESVVVCPVNYKHVEKAMERLKQNENMFKELLNVENCNQYPTMLKNCTQVHVGPKIEIHSEESKASCVKKDDDERTEMLKTCCQMLKNKYTTNFSYMRSFLWEGKRNDFPLRDYFVELTVNKADLFGKKSGEKISLNEIFSIKQNGHQTILVTGNPGYGKSTLCKKIVYDWATTNYLKHFDLTFIVILRELGDRSVTDALIDNMHEYSSINKDWKFQKRQQNILVILDGLDEIVEKSKIIKFIREESFYISCQMSIMVTSRPQAAEDIREDMHTRFSIEGFSPEYQKKYIQLMFREDESKANELFSLLKKNKFYREIAECPLMLHMLCCLHQNEEMEKLDTMTDLYIRIFSLITERYVRKTDQIGKFKSGKYFIGEYLLLKLGELHRESHFITSERLRYYFPKEDEYNFAMGLDILTLDSFSQYDNTIRYSFVHRTFGEFLTALLRYFNFFPFIRIYNVGLLFLLGFYNDEPLPKKLLRAIEKDTLRSDFMRLVYQNIKVKRNWKKFCSHSRVIFPSWIDLFLIQEQWKLYEFKELYLYFYENMNDYVGTEDFAISCMNDRSFPNKVKIYLILSLEREPWENKYDIREPVSRIIYLLHKMNTRNFDIFLIGVKKLFYRSKLRRFTNVNFNLYLSDDNLKLLKVNKDETLVALETTNDLKVSFSYILSLKQYETLRRHIIFESASKQNSKYVMM